MANTFYNFYYDPVRQGYDPNSWRSLFGTPVISGNQLIFNQSTAIHLADLLRGDVYFNINLTTPKAGDVKTWGLMQFSQNEYITFSLINSVFSANTSDGTTQYSTPITWQSSWSNVNIEYRIKWEAGLVSFFVGGVLQARIPYQTVLDVPLSTVPGYPLSLYISDFSIPSSYHISLNYIDVRGVESYLLNTSASSGASFPLIIAKEDTLVISELVTMSPATTMPLSVVDILTTNENITVLQIVDGVNVHETLTTSEVVTVTKSSTLLTPSVTNQLTTNEVVTVVMP